MEIIKLNAIDSTNSFLKQMALQTQLKDYTVVVTNSQTKGRGQMEALWKSEPFKNLTFSIFAKVNNVKIEHQSYLSFAVSLAIYKVLQDMSVPKLSVKWPNDIMAANKKICGILIETTFTKNLIKNAIIGIGLNVNQEYFTDDLPNATSLKLELKQEFDLHKLLTKIVDSVKTKLQLFKKYEFDFIHKSYTSVLYKSRIETTFFNVKKQHYFRGKILTVNSDGKIIIEIDNNSISEFNTKEIAFVTT